MRDKMTGLYNRDFYIEMLPSIIEQYREDKKCFALIYCDMNYLKSINDVYGHEVGDTALRSIAIRLTRCLYRLGDIIIRMGGDEFLIVVRLAKPEDIDVILQNIRETVQIPLRDHKTIVPSISLGAQVYDLSKDEPKSLDDMYKEVDGKIVLVE